MYVDVKFTRSFRAKVAYKVQIDHIWNEKRKYRHISDCQFTNAHIVYEFFVCLLVVFFSFDFKSPKAIEEFPIRTLCVCWVDKMCFLKIQYYCGKKVYIKSSNSMWYRDCQLILTFCTMFPLHRLPLFYLPFEQSKVAFRWGSFEFYCQCLRWKDSILLIQFAKMSAEKIDSNKMRNERKFFVRFWPFTVCTAWLVA